MTEDKNKKQGNTNYKWRNCNELWSNRDVRAKHNIYKRDHMTVQSDVEEEWHPRGTENFVKKGTKDWACLIRALNVLNWKQSCMSA